MGNLVAVSASVRGTPETTEQRKQREEAENNKLIVDN